MITRARVAAAGAALFFSALSCGGPDRAVGSPGGDRPSAVILSPPAETLSVGVVAQFTATARDPQGSPLLSAVPSWSSSNASVAAVTQTGQVTAAAVGQALITATYLGVAGSADVTVVAGPVGNRDFAIAAAQITQGVQDSAGSIPIVLGGNPALVNVFLRAAPAAAASMRVVLRLLDAGGAVVYADTATTTGAIPSAPTPTAPTVQFLVPAARLAAGLRWQVVRDPAGLVPDDSAADDVYPRDGAAPLATVTVPPLTIRFVPIVLGANGGTTAPLSTADFPDYLRTLKSVHPLGAVSAHVGPSFVTSANFGAPPSGGDVSFWIGLISQLDLARIADPTEPDANWFGVVLPPPGFNFTSTGGFSYIPSNGSATGPNTRTSSAVGPRWFSRPTQARDLVAHEIGHSFGRLHAPCGGAGAPLDPVYPIPGGLIDATGFDVFAWANGLASSAPAVSTNTGDVMGYCFPVWASTYTYKAVLDFRQPAVLAARGAAAPAPRQRVLVVRGSITNGDTIAIEPAFTLDARPTSVNASAPYRVSGLAADGRVLFIAGFEPAVIDHAPAVRHFTVAVPASAELESSLTSIIITTPFGQAARRRPAGLAAGAAPIRATAVRRPAGGGVDVACTGASTGLVVLDATGTVRGVASAPSAFLPAEAAGSITILCSDGVRTTRLPGVVPTAR